MSEPISVQIIVPECSDDAVSEGLRRLTEAIHRAGKADGSAGGIFGGEWGYGSNLENETFMMHRFCWCETDECLWCGGSRCQGEMKRLPHGEDCYQTRLEALRQKYGERLEWGWYVEWRGPKWASYEREKRALCVEMGRDFDLGNEVHCTCGSDEDWRRRYDACDCDWHAGRGRFIYGRGVDAPHFWHKASGSSARWYKYIGRDMETDLRMPWEAILADCLLSLSGGRPE